MTSLERLKLIAPEFGETDNDILSFFLGLAAERVGPVIFGSLYAQAVIFLAAHLLAVRERGLGVGSLGGSIASIKTGDLAVSFGASGAVRMGDDALAQTSYGREFLALREMVATSPWCV